MATSIIIWFLLSSCISQIQAYIYDENSKYIYLPPAHNDLSQYFGYSVLLSDNNHRLSVGAPGWIRFQTINTNLYSGAVFDCDINLIDHSNSYCTQSTYTIPSTTSSTDTDFTKNMALGSSLVEIANGTNSKLVMCGPRWSHKQGNVQTIHGVCLTEQGAIYLNPFDDSNDKKQFNNSKPHLAYGMAGFSAAVTTDNKWLLLGAPGLGDFKGGLARYIIKTAAEFEKKPEVFFEDMQSDSYLGYSVDSAIFDPETKETLIVSGAPRGGNLNGTVIIFSNNDSKVKKEDIRVTLTGNQRWEYFGASVLAVDLDGDGRKDLLVGAPHRSFPKHIECCFDQGVVYVFLNKYDKDNGFTLVPADEVTGSSSNNARFGSTLADLGDVDGDGYSDVAIGAPFERTGAMSRSGAVYIFRGGLHGLQARYSQKLFPQDLQLGGFGFSLSRGVDIDKNGCRDLAVGGVFGNAVAMYRCVPTLTVESYIGNSKLVKSICSKYIILPSDTKIMPIKLCIKVAKTKEEWNQARLHLSSTILINNKLYKTEILTITTERNMEPCTTMEITREETLKEMTVNFNLKQVVNNRLDGSFDTKQINLGENSVLNSSLSAFFADCGNDSRCDPNFIINHSVFNRTYIPGTNTSLGFNITLANTGEAAFGTRLNITIPEGIEIKNKFGGCEFEKNWIDCNFKYFFKEDPQKNWSIKFNHRPLIAAGPLNFSYTLSDCEKTIISDQFFIDVELQANIMINGGKTPELPLVVNRADVDNNKTLRFDHSFYIINRGPSDYPNVTINIQLPSEATLEKTPSDCLLQSGNDAVVLRCVYNIPFSPNSATTISLPFTLNTQSQESFLYSGKNLTTIATLSYGETNKTAEIITRVDMEPQSEVKYWAIILSVLAGLLIIAAIIYIMYRFGFFVREKKNELDVLRTRNSMVNLNSDEDTEPINPTASVTIHSDDL